MENVELKDIRIRAPNAGELRSLYELARSCGGELPQWSRKDYECLLTATAGRKRKVLVVSPDDKIAGFGVVSHVTETADGGGGTQPEWELEIIVIAREERRQGLGSRLLRELLKQAGGEGAGKMFLEVRESIFAARLLYEKTGFTSCGRRRGYYHLPEEDAMIYEFLFGERILKKDDGIALIGI